MARTKGQRGNLALLGKNVERRRETDDWNYRFNVGGQPYYGPCNTTDKRKAEKLAASLKAEKKVETGKDRAIGLGPMRFGAACDNWWNDVGSKNVETGLKTRLDWLRLQIGEARFLKDITPEIVTEAKLARAKCTRPAGTDAKGRSITRSLSPAYVKATLVTLRSVINYNSKNKGAAAQMLDWRNWIKKDDEDEDVRVMQDFEQTLIWPVLAELDADVLEVAEFNLGHPKRINELLPLEWPRVDLASHAASIRIKLKGKKKLFFDPIGPDEVMRLQAIKARKHHPSAVFTYVSRRTRVYNGVKHVAGQRRPMTYQHFYEQWMAACKKVGIEDLNPHCLRHTGATRWYAKTKDIYFVSKLLNHANIETTEKFYLHNDHSVIRETKARHSEGLPKKVSAKVSARLRVV